MPPKKVIHTPLLKQEHVKWPAHIPLIQQVFEHVDEQKRENSKKPVEAYRAPTIGSAMWVAVFIFILSILILDICTCRRPIQEVKRKTIQQKAANKSSYQADFSNLKTI